MKTTMIAVLALGLAGCATVRPRPAAPAAAAPGARPADAPLAEAPERASLPTIPKLVKHCEPVLWWTVGSAVLGGVAIYMATSGVDTLNPDPSAPLPGSLRGLKAGAGAVGAGTAVLTASLTSILGQCREDVAAPAPPEGSR